MLEGYKNFQLSMFVTVRDINLMADHADKMREQMEFFRKHLKLNKLYLECFRSEETDLDKVLRVKAFFEQNGMDLSAAYTPCSLHDEGHEHRISQCLCYNDPAAMARTRRLFESMAAHFDAILLDDYVFTNCTCDKCRAAKGKRTWSEYRLALMYDACRTYMVEPARAVNPNVKITLKYPTWHEAYQRTGYNTAQSPLLFDEIYSGTETRNDEYSHFRHPRYTSYSLMRYLSSFEPHTNRGNWFDTGGEVDVVDMLEQAYLSLFGDPREMTLYCWRSFVDTLYVPAMGFELQRIDRFLGKLGKPIGVPVYLPHDACGEDHIYDFLGMSGIPVEPTVAFPQDGPVMLTAASAGDPDLIGRIHRHLLGGGTVFVTPGCMHRLQDGGLEEFTGMRIHSYSQTSDEFSVSVRDHFQAGHARAVKQISMRVLDFKINESDCVISQDLPALPNPLLAFSNYGAGRFYVVNVPDNWSDLYCLPAHALNQLRRVLSLSVPVRIDGPARVALFPRDNDTCVIESFLPHSCAVQLRVKGDVEQIINLETGERIGREWMDHGESVFTVTVRKSNFVALGW